MTSHPLRRRIEPTSGFRRFVRPAAAGTVLLSLFVVAGCGGEEQAAVAPPPPPPPPPAAPVKPKTTSVQDLMAQLAIDERVYMEDGAAPGTTEERQAVLEFFDAFVRGSDSTLRPMLSESDRPFLDLMVELGTFVPITEAIESVDVIAGSSPDGRPAVLGMYVRDGVDEYQLWYYEVDAGIASFQAAPTPPGIVQRLSGPLDGYIDRWHEILDEEMRLASQPDEEIRLDVNLDEGEEGESGGSSASPGASPNTPGPGGGPRRHRPNGRRRPPGIPG